MMSETIADKSTYRKANWALGITALGLVAAYPFQSNFWGGLLTSGCSAGLVGGLADWFAVTALFRRPLGIRPGKVFRTEIIPRNRERIFTALVHMVQDELLSQEALTKKLEDLDFAAWIARTIDAEELERFQTVIQSFVMTILGTVEREDLKDLIRGKLDSLPHEILQEVFKVSRANGSLEKGLSVLALELGRWVQSPEMHRVLSTWIDNALTDYVNENPSRKIVQMFLPDTHELTARIQVQMINYLTGGEAVNAALEWLGNFVQSDHFSVWTQQIVLPFIKKGEENALTQALDTLQQPQSSQKMTDLILRQVENYRLKLTEQTEKRRDLNRNVRMLLNQFIEKQHDRIGKLVREGLEKYSDEMLVQLLEAKAGPDLQMIRINGSVVGALAGMLFYIVNFFL